MGSKIDTESKLGKVGAGERGIKLRRWREKMLRERESIGVVCSIKPSAVDTS